MRFGAIRTTLAVAEGRAMTEASVRLSPPTSDLALVPWQGRVLLDGSFPALLISGLARS